MTIYDLLLSRVRTNRKAITFYDICVAVAAWLSQFTTAESDYAVRELAGELTLAEMVREDLAEEANHERHMASARFWSGV